MRRKSKDLHGYPDRGDDEAASTKPSKLTGSNQIQCGGQKITGAALEGAVRVEPELGF